PMLDLRTDLERDIVIPRGHINLAITSLGGDPLRNTAVTITTVNGLTAQTPFSCTWTGTTDDNGHVTVDAWFGAQTMHIDAGGFGANFDYAGGDQTITTGVALSAFTGTVTFDNGQPAPGTLTVDPNTTNLQPDGSFDIHTAPGTY